MNEDDLTSGTKRNVLLDIIAGYSFKLGDDDCYYQNLYKCSLAWYNDRCRNKSGKARFSVRMLIIKDKSDPTKNFQSKTTWQHHRMMRDAIFHILLSHGLESETFVEIQQIGLRTDLDICIRI
jgi:hypothetical protein